jgi:hypothetical protein
VTPAADLYLRLLQPLGQAGIPYMITGGLAAILYGEPRLTNDVDIVLRLGPGDADRLATAFAGPAWYAPPIETIRTEASREAHGHFNLLELETSLRADIYCLGGDPLGEWAMSRRRTVSVSGETVWVAPIEYVMLQKLRYFRESGSDRHLRDIAAMHRISGHLIDRAALDAWLERLDLRAEWRRATEIA